MKFFVVPVVAIFTKFDALEVSAYSELIDELKGEPETIHKEAIAQAPARALADFQKNYLPDLYARKYPPRRHVYLRNMNKVETDCCELIETIAAVLDNGNIQRLFVSTQRNNLGTCIKYAVSKELMAATAMMDESGAAVLTTRMQMAMVAWYPHFVSYPLGKNHEIYN
jgi:hypothetical protein